MEKRRKKEESRKEKKKENEKAQATIISTKKRVANVTTKVIENRMRMSKTKRESGGDG